MNRSAGRISIYSAAQERRTRQRSRFGCRDCKLRKVKVGDQSTLSVTVAGRDNDCREPLSATNGNHVVRNVARLASVATSCLRYLVSSLWLRDTGGSLVVRERTELHPPPSRVVWASDQSTSYQLNAKCQDFINRYLGRSLITPDDPDLVHVNRRLLRLAFAVSIWFILLPRGLYGFQTATEARWDIYMMSLTPANRC